MNDEKKIDWKKLTEDEVWEHAKVPLMIFTNNAYWPGIFCCKPMAFCVVYDDTWIVDENSTIFLKVAGLKSEIIEETKLEIKYCPFCRVEIIDGFSQDNLSSWEQFFIQGKKGYYRQADLTNKNGFGFAYYVYSIFYCSRIQFFERLLVKKICCLKLQGLINDPRSPFLYIPWLNYLVFGYVNRGSPELLPYPLNVLLWLQFCPFCAHEFGPKNYYFLWGKIILSKFGINVHLLEFIPFPNLDEKCVFGQEFDSLVEKLSTIDHKYKTQEWWQGWKFSERIAECGPACCETMEDRIHPYSQYSVIYYRAWARQYYDSIQKNKFEVGVVYPEEDILVCPYCNTGLPKSLLSEWRRITEEEFGVYDMPYEARLDKIPEKFRTEEWWLKRGL